jgi:hypothetical protein
VATPGIEQRLAKPITDRQRAVQDIVAGAVGGVIATAAAGVGILPAVGVGVVAGMLFAYLERNKLTK